MSILSSKKTNRLDFEQFTYQKTKDGKLFVFWQGKKVRSYSNAKAQSIIVELDEATSEREVQLALARVSGNFKRGNER